MTAEQAELLADAVLGAEVRYDYSGRGMYGQETASVTFDDHRDVYSAVAIVAAKLADDPVAVRDFIKAVGRFRYDSLGRDIIVY